MDTTSQAELRFVDYLRPLWWRKWLILTAVVVATGAVYAYYQHKPRVYTSATPVFVQDPGDPISGAPTPQSTDRNVSNLAALMYSRSVAASVVKSIHFQGTPEELLRRVSLTSKVGEDFVNVVAEGRSPSEAASIANGYANEFVTLINSSQTTRITRALELSRQQLKALPRGPATSMERQNLGDQIRRLELARSVPQSTARQTDPALPPGGPSAPKPVRNALFAFVLSLLAAIGVAFGLERFDRRLKSPEEFDDSYGHPLLAIVPHTDKPAPRRDGAAALGPDFSEPFRLLRTSIDLTRIDDPPRTVVISSAMPGEGKSTVVRNMALAYCETGKRVAVVDADLRHPSLPALFDLEPGPGLTDVMRGGAPLNEVLHPVGVAVHGLGDVLDLQHQRVPAGVGAAVGLNGAARAAAAAPAANGNGRHPTGVVNVLLAGRMAPNPTSVLASDRLVEVLDELRDSHDIVLIDSAPLLAVTDTVPLLRYADAAVFVGRLGVTTRDTAKRLAEFLRRVPDVDVLGIVANDLSRLEAAGYGYGYGYGYGGPEGESSKPSGRRGRKRQPA